MHRTITFHCCILYFLCLVISSSQAAVFVIPSNGDIIGKTQRTSSEVNESIEDVGRRFGIGYYEMVNANPHADSIHTLSANTALIIPSQFILPSAPREGIVINLAEYRLYYFPPDENVVITFPIGIGKKGWSTPVGTTKVIAKVTHPTWRPTAKVLAAAEQIGAPLPDVFPPGPNNPLGDYALRLAWPSFLIHGTNRVDGIGARVSAGCIRMLPNDIEFLFNTVKTGTKVKVINEPIKIGRAGSIFFLQMYPLLSEEKNENLNNLFNKKISSLNLKDVRKKLILNEFSHPSGLLKQLT